MTEIIKAIRKAAGQNADIILGEVTNFDKETWCATVKFNKTLELDQVSVKCVINSEASGILVEPKIGSQVSCGLIDGKIENLFIITYSEVVKYRLITDLIELNGDSNGGLLIESKLVQELKKVNQLLQSLTSVINGAPVPEPGNGSPSALQISLKAAIAGKQLPTYEDITNQKVKHGE